MCGKVSGKYGYPFKVVIKEQIFDEGDLMAKRAKAEVEFQ